MRFRPVLAATLLAALALAGCSDDGQGDPEATASGSASASASADPQATSGPAQTGNELADRLNAALTEEGSYRATVANAEAGAPVVAEAVVAGESMSLHATIDENTQLIRIDGKGVWYTDEQGAWHSGEELGEAVGMFDVLLFLFDQRSQIGGITAIPTMNNLGEETINGVTATHYQGGTSAKEFGNALKPASVALQNTDGDVAVDLWVDEEGRMIRFDYLLVPGEEVPEDGPATAQTTTYSDFGRKFTVEPPAMG